MAELTAAQKRLIELDRKKAEIKAFYEELEAVTRTVIVQAAMTRGASVADGYGFYFQDPETGAVYKTEKPQGKFVQFTEWGYCRTKLAGEERGALSVKEAEAQGFKCK